MDSVNLWTANWARKKNVAHYYQPEIDSTNAWAKTSFRASKMSAVYLADHQSSGRGRGTHRWTNTGPGTTLLSTWCFKLDNLPQPLFNMRIGYAIFEAIEKTWPQLSLGLKAPNDIYLGDGKLAGILTEITVGDREPALFIGIGLNALSRPELPDQRTACLADSLTLNTSSWFIFCDHLFSRLETLSKDTSRETLLPTEIVNLLRALKKYPGNTIANVEPDASLIMNDGSLRHWNEL